MGQAPGGGRWAAGAPALPTVAGAPRPPPPTWLLCFRALLWLWLLLFPCAEPHLRGPDLETWLSSEGEQCGSSPHSRKMVSEFHDVSLTVMLFGKSHPLRVDAYF